jgi:chemotaxis protein histidine kinase CheA
MPQPKSGHPAAGGFEVIDAGSDLKAKVREIPVRSPQDDPVARAEAAVEQLATHFDDWMKDEVAKVVEGHEAWTDGGGCPGDAQEAFFRAVHDVKGQAATLGFPLAARVAGSLCGLLDHMDGSVRTPRTLVDSHVDAIEAIFRERAKGEADRVGVALVEALEAVSARWLAENAAGDDPT